MNLIKFQDQAKNRSGRDYTQSPFRIQSKDLDKNFKMVTPGERQGDKKPYTIESEDDKEYFIVPEQVFWVCVDGQAKQYKFLAEPVN